MDIQNCVLKMKVLSIMTVTMWHIRNSHWQTKDCLLNFQLIRKVQRPYQCCSGCTCKIISIGVYSKVSVGSRQKKPNINPIIHPVFTNMNILYGLVKFYRRFGKSDFHNLWLIFFLLTCSTGVSHNKLRKVFPYLWIHGWIIKKIQYESAVCEGLGLYERLNELIQSKMQGDGVNDCSRPNLC